jgi:plastocyanin
MIVARLSCLAVFAALLPAGPACAAPVTHTVVIEGMAFKPAILRVKAGDTIVWLNSDLVPHTVTAAAQRIESGDVAMDKSWRWRAMKPGTIDYVCRFHPMMRGHVVVTR